VVGKNLVIATGAAPVRSHVLKNNNICYNPREITVNPKNKPAVVYGENSDAVNYALLLAKKFKYVYLCSETFNLHCEAKLLKKLNDTANIVHLPNCHIVSCKNAKDGQLTEITLDTYDTINCSALVLALGRIPDVNGVSTTMIELDDERYVKINTQHQTTKVNNIYAIGECTRHNTKRSITTVGNCLIGR
jgi:thioredoxin reductase